MISLILFFWETKGNGIATVVDLYPQKLRTTEFAQSGLLLLLIDTSIMVSKMCEMLGFAVKVRFA
jgi:hypothetical protein